MDWTAKKAEEAEKTLGRWADAVTSLDYEILEASNVPKEIIAALANDINTPEAISILHRLYNDGRVEDLKASLRILGFDPVKMFELSMVGSSERLRQMLHQSSVNELAEKLNILREASMQTKDFSEVDSLKSALIEAGIEVRMSKAGVELFTTPYFDPSKLEGL